MWRKKWAEGGEGVGGGSGPREVKAWRRKWVEGSEGVEEEVG